MRISRVRLQQNKSAEPPRVRFHTMPSVRMGCTEREPVADGERAVAVVELPQRNVICSEEIRGELQSARPSQHLIRNEAIPSNTSASRNQAISTHLLILLCLVLYFSNKTLVLYTSTYCTGVREKLTRFDLSNGF